MEITFGPGEQLRFLSIIIALSAYLGGIRLFLKKEIRQLPSLKGSRKPNDEIQKREDERDKIKEAIISISYPDIPLVLAGLFLGFNLFCEHLIGKKPWPCLLPASMWLFGIAGGILAWLHFGVWIRSIQENLKVQNS